MVDKPQGPPGTGESTGVPTDPPEEWASWETRLCLWSLGLGLAGLIVLGTLINVFVL